MPALYARIVAMLAAWKGLYRKEISARSGIPYAEVSRHLRKDRLDERWYRRLLVGVDARPAEVALVTGCAEALAALGQAQDPPEPGGLTREEAEAVELSVLAASQLLRPVLAEAARLSRQCPPLDAYPKPGEVEAARWQAGVLFDHLQALPLEHQKALVTAARQLQSWALLERCCEESEVWASRDLDRAEHLADLALEIARQVRGPAGWRRALQAWAEAHAANIRRARSGPEAARERFERAKALWRQGQDPDQVLDPGRLLDLEASLCRAERKFEAALACLEEARPLSRAPARLLIKKGFTLEVMGEYPGAIAALLEAGPLLDREAQPRLYYMQRFNLGVVYTHVQRYAEATALVEEVRELALANGDGNELIRVTWLTGRIAAGQGRHAEARALLELACRQLAARRMWYDLALALLELSALHLDEGRTAEVRALARGLQEVFAAQGVHREALAALRLFHAAAEREEATASLARRLLAYLFRARHDPGLRFAGSEAP